MSTTWIASSRPVGKGCLASGLPLVSVQTPTPRRRTRRQEILEIAVQLFATRGYHGVSMDDIGGAAGGPRPARYPPLPGQEGGVAGGAPPGRAAPPPGGGGRGGARARALSPHFAGREARRGAAPTPVSEQLRRGGGDRGAACAGARAAALPALVRSHVDSPPPTPAVITLHLHELDRLPEEPRRQ